SSSDEGGAIAVRGSRSNATDFYIDGMLVIGTLIPESEIDQLQIVTGGIEAQYGDVTGGIISITTKGPSSKWAGGVEVETSEFFDAYDNRLAGFNLSGPLLKNKNDEAVIGIRLAGRYTYQYDDDAPAVDIFRVTDEALRELEANPIVQRTNANGTVSNFVAADFTTNEDVQVLDANPFEELTRYDLTAKIDARVNKAIDFTFSGSLRDESDQFTPQDVSWKPGSRDGAAGSGIWRVFNAHNNPTDNILNLRGNFRFRHRLGGAGLEEGDDQASVIQNASYTLQFSYENNTGEYGDARHGDNYFQYGHVGNFDIEWVPTFEFDFQEGALRHTDYLEVLRNYTASETNPVLANYNNVLDLPGEGEQFNPNIGNSAITGDFGAQQVGIGFDNFIARNGEISDQFDDSWGNHTNVGWVYNRARSYNNDIITGNINSSFDLVPGGDSDRGRHNIQFGILYEQRTNRRYAINPRDLWDVARQQVNAHIQGIPENPVVIDQLEVFNPINATMDTVDIFGLAISENPDNAFYRRIRDVLVNPQTDELYRLEEYVNVDGLDPSQLSLDMFSARELNDQQLLSYYGYDYLGNEFNGTFEEFFTATDADGVRTFPVAANRPIYFAGFIQDKFTFKDIIFRLGLRVDRYDANTSVLKDNYSLYEIQGASDFHAANPDLVRPNNIGDDFKVYSNEAGTAVEAYRDGDDWYRGNGAPTNSPSEIFAGGLVNPVYVDERANTEGYIKSREFNTDASFEDYEPQINFMPRLAFSFPISDDANFFAHYDILVQRPPSNTIATALDYFYFTDVNVTRNNPNLRPERTIDYEVGFQQRLSASSSVKISAYYKEMRDMIQRRTFFPVPIVNQYTTFDNLDFGTVKGFTLAYDLRRTNNITLQANYTLQFADGTGSDANSQRGLTSRGNIRNLSPLSFDERHRLVATVD
ncbi:MAG: TonB-dependent receptor, partial [Bacteroidota bacterium]